jgi:hypothetical protein
VPTMMKSVRDYLGLAGWIVLCANIFTVLHSFHTCRSISIRMVEVERPKGGIPFTNK